MSLARHTRRTACTLSLSILAACSGGPGVETSPRPSGGGTPAPEPAGDAPVAVAVAASYCAEAAVHACEEAVQLHGGIGMTWEHPAHLHLKRAKADALLLGTPEAHRRALAVLVDLPEA